MVKPEWGIKRACTVCTVRFYDLNKKPPTCPKCGATIELVVRGKRSKVDKQKDIDPDTLLNVDIDFGDADIIVDEALLDDDDSLDDALDDIDVDNR